jgi:hypothetical protein
MLVKRDQETKSVFLNLIGEDLLPILQKDASFAQGYVVTHVSNLVRSRDEQNVGRWIHEYAKYQLESTPYNPYSDEAEDLLSVECNMKKRFVGLKMDSITLNVDEILFNRECTMMKQSLR